MSGVIYKVMSKGPPNTLSCQQNRLRFENNFESHQIKLLKDQKLVKYLTCVVDNILKY